MPLRDITVMVSPEGKPQRTVVAESGKIEVDEKAKKIYLALKKGSIHEYSPENPDQYSTVTFGNMKVPVSIEAIEKYIERGRRYKETGMFGKKEMSVRELARRIGEAAKGSHKKKELIAELAGRAAKAFMPLTFVLIGAPLGIVPYKARRFYGLAVCGLLMLSYYAIVMLCGTMFKKGLVSPVLSMWIPNILLGFVGAVFIIRSERR